MQTERRGRRDVGRERGGAHDGMDIRLRADGLERGQAERTKVSMGDMGAVLSWSVQPEP